MLLAPRRYRFEFAKSRGAIHFHALGWYYEAAARIHSLLDRARDCTSCAAHAVIEDTAAQELGVALRGALGVEFTALHPAGRADTGERPAGLPEGQLPSWVGRRLRACDLAHKATARKRQAELLEAGLPMDGAAMPEETAEERTFREKYVLGDDVPCDQIGNFARWPAPEGFYNSVRNGPERAAVTKPLRTKVYELSPGNTKEAVDDLCAFVNSVLLHSCSSYCLRSSKRKSKLPDGSSRAILGWPSHVQMHLQV